MEKIRDCIAQSRVAALWGKHFSLSLLVFLAVTNSLLYAPALVSYFTSDDFQFLSYLYFNVGQILDGQKWEEWFIGGIDGYLFFRPVGNLFWFTDYIAYNLNPFGYHAVNVILHVLASFEVFILCRLITSNRTTSALAATIFAVMPVHAEAVAWTAARFDILSGLYYFASLIFFVLYLRRGALRLYLISLGAFLLAVSSKEMALTLPIIILLYDALLNPRGPFRVLEALRRHVPFWGLVLIRLGLWGRGYRGLQLIPGDLWSWMDGNILRIVDPLVPDITSEARWIFALCTILLFFMYRDRRQVLFGLVWIPITYAATINSITGPTARSFYIPSLGLSLVIASVLTRPILRPSRVARSLGVAMLLMLIVSYSAVLITRSQLYYRAGEVAQAIPQQVKSLHPTLPPGARLVFVGVPDQVLEGPLVYISGLQNAMILNYSDSSLQVSKFFKFPIWLDGLDRTYFFQVDHRRVTERADLVRALEERKRCAGFSRLATEWDFSKSPQGWEPWSQLSGFEIREGALMARAEGSDPYMASPPIDISSIAIGEIEITMLVRASEPKLKGAIYWLAEGQQDFSPALQASFAVQPDGKFHTYRVDVAETGMLAIGERIVQLRLDPVDAPAEIAIKSVKVFVGCDNEEVERCVCSR